ncbi:MAG: hypothetical protein LUQ04_10870 [Methanoregula sp.]|nr:hypothetical protein [Methanoregula sp.]
MIQDHRTAVFPAPVVACVSASGCTQNKGIGAMTPVSPAIMVKSAQDTRTEPTNQDSPRAATIRDEASCMPLD